jgi:hypothetical protein
VNTYASPITIVLEDDKIKARFLREGDIVIAQDGRQFTIGAARCDSDTHVVYSAYNSLGGIEAVRFERDEWAQLATEV